MVGLEGEIFVVRSDLVARSKYFLSELGDKNWVTIMTGLFSLDQSLEILGRPCFGPSFIARFSSDNGDQKNPLGAAVSGQIHPVFSSLCFLWCCF